MSETRSGYIAGAAEINTSSDMLIRRHGDLVQVIGYPVMAFTADEAAYLAYELLDCARVCGWVDPDMDSGPG